MAAGAVESLAFYRCRCVCMLWIQSWNTFRRQVVFCRIWNDRRNFTWFVYRFILTFHMDVYVCACAMCNVHRQNIQRNRFPLVLLFQVHVHVRL